MGSAASTGAPVHIANDNENRRGSLGYDNEELRERPQYMKVYGKYDHLYEHLLTIASLQEA